MLPNKKKPNQRKSIWCLFIVLFAGTFINPCHAIHSSTHHKQPNAYPIKIDATSKWNRKLHTKKLYEHKTKLSSSLPKTSEKTINATRKKKKSTLTRKNMLEKCETNEYKAQLNLLKASFEDNGMLATDLLDNNTDPNCELISASKKKLYGGSPLCNAVRNADIELVDDLLYYGAQSNIIAEYDATLDKINKNALQADYIEIQTILTSAGAQNTKSTALNIATQLANKALKIEKEQAQTTNIRKKQIERENLCAKTLILDKIESVTVQAKILLKKRKTNDSQTKKKQKQESNTTQKDLQLALIKATFKNDKQQALKLIEQGADPNSTRIPPSKRKHLGGTPLCNAIQFGNIGLIKVLLEAGANPNCICNRNGTRDTPLRVAVRQFTKGADYPAIIKLLIKHGANVNLGGMNSKEKKSHTPLMIHTYTNKPRKDIFDTLLKCNADINKQDFQGNTALHIAAKVSRSCVMCNLINAGADASIKNKRGETALNIAQKNNKSHILKILNAYVASSKKSTQKKNIKPSKQQLQKKARNKKRRQRRKAAKLRKKTNASSSSAQISKKTKKQKVKMGASDHTFFKKALKAEINNQSDFYHGKLAVNLNKYMVFSQAILLDNEKVTTYSKELSTSKIRMRTLLSNIIDHAQITIKGQSGQKNSQTKQSKPENKSTKRAKIKMGGNDHAFLKKAIKAEINNQSNFYRGKCQVNLNKYIAFSKMVSSDNTLKTAYSKEFNVSKQRMRRLLLNAMMHARSALQKN